MATATTTTSKGKGKATTTTTSQEAKTMATATTTTSKNTGMPSTSGVGRQVGNGNGKGEGQGNGNGKGHQPDVKVNKANGKIELTKAEIKGLVLAGKAYDKNWKSGWTLGKKFSASQDKTGDGIKKLHAVAYEERMVEVRAELHEYYNGNKPQIEEALKDGRFYPSYETVNKAVVAYRNGMKSWGGPPTNIVQEARIKAWLWTSKAAKRAADALEAKANGQGEGEGQGESQGEGQGDNGSRVAYEEHIFKAVRSAKRTMKDAKGAEIFDALHSALITAAKREGITYRDCGKGKATTSKGK